MQPYDNIFFELVQYLAAIKYSERKEIISRMNSWKQI
jgi:hypothetical protein